MNGKKISADELAPGWTNYRKTVFYNAYNVTGALQQGANAIGVLVGNGIYNVQKIPGRYTKFVGSLGQPKLISQLHITYGDGSSEVVRSDPSWRFQEGPITFSHA